MIIVFPGEHINILIARKTIDYIHYQLNKRMINHATATNSSYLSLAVDTGSIVDSHCAGVVMA